jgi:hypothetical protein
LQPSIVKFNNDLSIADHSKLMPVKNIETVKTISDEND